MGLVTYRRKRDFSRTAEPRGGRGRPGTGVRPRGTGRRKRLVFTVQKHDASRLHYDLRLEWDGVLKSWAVPKGPSLDPSVKSLAVEVEDHPLEYGTFEDVIPEGEYGAGPVLLWDRGTWEPQNDPAEGLKAGKLEFEVHGKKLAGAWRLVRMRPEETRNNWLLMKVNDAFARPGSDVVSERPESVKTGRTIEGVAEGSKARARPVSQARRTRAAVGPSRKGPASEIVEEKAMPRQGSRRAARGRKTVIAGRTAPRRSSATPVRTVIVRRGTKRGNGVSLTNPDRVLFPDEGITKSELASYYEAVADVMLPHIAGRPLMLLRCPQGFSSACFFQKHPSGPIPEQLKGIPIYEEQDGETETYLYLDGRPGLTALAQVNALEIHTWGSRVEHLEMPDRLVFDLDPGPGVRWSVVTETAVAVRDVLEGLGLTSFVKTSGGKGLHIVVPLRPRAAWPQVKEFAHAVTTGLVRAAPDRLVGTMTRSARAGKIFIDYLRNGRGATCVEVLSTRARPGAPVSMPLAWKALAGVDSPRQFTLRNTPKHLRRVRDPWTGYFQTRQSLSQGVLRAAGVRA